MVRLGQNRQQRLAGLALKGGCGVAGQGIEKCHPLGAVDPAVDGCSASAFDPGGLLSGGQQGPAGVQGAPGKSPDGRGLVPGNQIEQGLRGCGVIDLGDRHDQHQARECPSRLHLPGVALDQVLAGAIDLLGRRFAGSFLTRSGRQHQEQPREADGQKNSGFHAKSPLAPRTLNQPGRGQKSLALGPDILPNILWLRPSSLPQDTTFASGFPGVTFMKKKSRLTYFMVLAMLIIVVVGTFLHLAHAQETPVAMSANPVFQVVEESFAQVALQQASLETISEGFGFTEGPVWLPGKAALVFSDIPRDTLHIYKPGKAVDVFRKPSHHANGNILDLQGRLITCEHGSRRVTRTDAEGNVEVLAQTYQGKKLNSPNDVAVKSDGTIWFTDPPYGLDLKKLDEQMEQPGCYVYRLDPGAQEPVPVAKTLTYPNGLCFSPDEKILYVADSHHKVHKVYRFEVKKDNTLGEKKLLADIRPGLPDGIRCDVKGRLYVTCGEGVQVYDSEGKLLGKILTPKTPANACFGGPDNKTLFLTSQDSVYRIETGAEGFFPKARK